MTPTAWLDRFDSFADEIVERALDEYVERLICCGVEPAMVTTSANVLLTDLVSAVAALRARAERCLEHAPESAIRWHEDTPS